MRSRPSAAPAAGSWRPPACMLCALWLGFALAAGDVPPAGEVPPAGDVDVHQQNPGHEIITAPVWLPPTQGPVRLTYLTTYGDRTEPFQITRVYGQGTGMFKYPDRDNVAHYQPFRTLEQESETTVNYLGKPIRQTQSIRRWFDSATGEVVRVELAATSGSPPSYYTAEKIGATLRIVHRLLPGEDPENPDGGENSRDLPIPPGGFIPLDMRFAAHHVKQWNWPPDSARRFTVFTPEEAVFRTWWLERLPNEKIDLPHLPGFDCLRFRMVSGPAPDQPGYLAWNPGEQLAQAQQFWVNPFTGEMLRALTPGPPGSRKNAPPGQDPERTATVVTYASETPPPLTPRKVVAPVLPTRTLDRLTTLGAFDFAVVINRKNVGALHFEFLPHTPPPAPPAPPSPPAPGPDAPPTPAAHADNLLRQATLRAIARLTIDTGQGERRETAETWFLPDGRVRKLAITGRRTLGDTLAYLQEIICAGEIFSINGLRIEQIPDPADPAKFIDGRRSPWSRAHVRDQNLRLFDTNRLEQFVALLEQFELVEQPDWRLGLYQLQSDTPQMMECHLERITGAAALQQFQAAIAVPSRADPDHDTYPRRADIQLVAARGEPLNDPAASDWQNRLRSGQAAVWQLTMAGPASGILAYFGADRRLYAVVQRDRNGRELHWVRIPPEPKTQPPATSFPHPIYPADW